MNIIKFVLSILFCNLYRLLKFIPNNDPIMGVMLPYSRQNKWYDSAAFAALTMISFDFITNALGIWTIITALTYAGLGLLFNLIYLNRKITLKTYISSGIIGVLLFDFITGPIMSSWLFNMSFTDAFFGQIPFTLWHLFSVTMFVGLLTPLLDKHLIHNPAIEDSKLLNKWLVRN